MAVNVMMCAIIIRLLVQHSIDSNLCLCAAMHILKTSQLLIANEI